MFSKLWFTWQSTNVLFFLWHSSHVEAVSVDVWYGPFWSQTHRQPLWRRRQSWWKHRGPFKMGKCVRNLSFQHFSHCCLPLFIHWPVWEIQGSTPACRPCRWGSTWRRRSQWCNPLWCSSLGTYNQKAWGAALSAGSSLWYTGKSWYTCILGMGNISVTLPYIINEIYKGSHNSVIMQNVNRNTTREVDANKCQGY